MAIIIEAASLRDARLAWQAAQFQIYAFHAPNDMPDQPGLDAPLSPASSAVEREIQEIRRRVILAYETKKAKRHGG